MCHLTRSVNRSWKFTVFQQKKGEIQTNTCFQRCTLYVGIAADWQVPSLCFAEICSPLVTVENLEVLTTMICCVPLKQKVEIILKNQHWTPPPLCHNCEVDGLPSIGISSQRCNFQIKTINALSFKKQQRLLKKKK